MYCLHCLSILDMSLQTNSTTNYTSSTGRPVRQAALEGVAARRDSQAFYGALDRRLSEDMGNANPVFTNAGTVRREYLGETPGFRFR